MVKEPHEQSDCVPQKINRHFYHAVRPVPDEEGHAMLNLYRRSPELVMLNTLKQILGSTATIESSVCDEGAL